METKRLQINLSPLIAAILLSCFGYHCLGGWGIVAALGLVAALARR